MPPTTPWIWISAGEASGDQRAAELLAALAEARPHRAMGIPGPRLRNAGVEAVVPMEGLQGFGLAEAAKGVPAAVSAIRRAVRVCRRRRPAVAVLVDYGEFHMQLGRRLRKLGVPVFHLAPPKLWAWGAWRVGRLRQSADALGLLFPFEAEFYRQHDFPTVQVGHPVARLLDAPEPPDRDKLLLLPGSRPSELGRHLPLVLAAAQRLAPVLPLQPVLGLAPGLELGRDAVLPRELTVRRLAEPADMADGALALAASGTVSLELGALGIPHVVLYRLNPITYAIAKAVVRTPLVSPLNILAGRELMPELIQQRATPAGLAASAQALWEQRDALARSARDEIAKLRRPDGLADAAALCWRLADGEAA